MSIGVQLIYGQNDEPFLEAALRAVEWADYVVAINTAPSHPVGRRNEETVAATVPEEKLRRGGIKFADDPFDFAAARNHALSLADVGDYVLLLDSDMVHYPAFEPEARQLVEQGYDMISALFYHLCVYRDLVHSIQDREILFSYEPGVTFAGKVHEAPEHPRRNPIMARTRFVHYGYVKPAREVAARWELYRSLGAEVHDYDATQPDRSLDDWPQVCERHFIDHPPAAASVIESYPDAPPRTGRCRIALVLLTWNDAENLRECLDSLADTLEPFELCLVDNGSTDGCAQMVEDWMREHSVDGAVFVHPDEHLSVALNVGFGHFLAREDLDYIGWIHPDHVFEWPDWLTRLRVEMDQHHEYAKLGAQEAGSSGSGLRPGNSQCYLVRRTMLERVGLFDERFVKCGGYEDWEINARLLQAGGVMITPEAMVRHKAMQTRARHDNLEAGYRNAETYYQLTGQREAFV